MILYFVLILVASYAVAVASYALASKEQRCFMARVHKLKWRCHSCYPCRLNFDRALDWLQDKEPEIKISYVGYGHGISATMQQYQQQRNLLQQMQAQSLPTATSPVSNRKPGT